MQHCIYLFPLSILGGVPVSIDVSVPSSMCLVLSLGPLCTLLGTSVVSGICPVGLTKDTKIANTLIITKPS